MGSLKVKGVQEFPFELQLCAHLEAEREGIIGRQLGGGVETPGARIVDVVHVTPGPEFRRRQQIGPKTIPQRALDADVKIRSADTITAVIEGPPDRAREVAERAAEAGFFECERRDGRWVVRQTVRYPDWFDHLTAIENKPDLDRPGDMAKQLRFDVAVGLFDHVILATADHVTGAHLNRIPDVVGVWRFDPGDRRLRVIREPTHLDATGPGTEIRAERALQTDLSLVAATSVQRARRRVAERAWGRGWRPKEFPACDNCTVTTDALPSCTYFDRLVDPATDCAPSCPGHQPAPPPDVDLAAHRAARTAWDPESAAFVSEQSDLRQFD